MAPRRDTTGGSNGDGGFLGRIGNALENRFAMILIASALGAGGGLGLVKSNPEVRADPFTGTMGRELEQRVMKHCDDHVFRLERELAAVKEEMLRQRQTAELYHNKVTRNEEKIISLGQAVATLRAVLGFNVSYLEQEQ